MSFVAAWLALVVVAVSAACGSPAPGAGIDVDRALAFVRELTDNGPRVANSSAAKAAAAQIASELAKDGIVAATEPVGEVELPPIVVLGRTYRRGRRVTVTDPNVVVSFGPPGPALVIMAHYDTVSGSPGALDNAAAVAVLLGLARELKREPPPQRVTLVFTAGEEVGLVGAEAFAAAHAPNVAFAIALDLVGGDGELSINGASTLIGRAELGWLAGAADRAGATLRAPPVHRVVSRWWPLAERSDHGAFTRRGVRAIHLYNRGHDGEWIDLAYHSPRDRAERVQRTAVDELGRLLRALVDSPVPAYAGDGYWIPLAAVVVPRAALLALELALLGVVVLSLVLSRDGLVATIAQQRQRATGPALLVGALCYAAAVAVAVGLELVTSGDHPSPWLHAPGTSLVAQACILAGAFGLVTRAVARFAAWRGEYRFLALAIVSLAVVGAVWLALGAAELAWGWLVPAALLTLAPRMGRAAPLAIAIAALPVALVLQPELLREAAWNGFLPPLPLSALLGALSIPVAATAAFALRRRPAPGPVGTLALGVGCGLLVIAGLAVAVASDRRCSAATFNEFHLACERV